MCGAEHTLPLPFSTEQVKPTKFISFCSQFMRFGIRLNFWKIFSFRNLPEFIRIQIQLSHKFPTRFVENGTGRGGG